MARIGFFLSRLLQGWGSGIGKAKTVFTIGSYQPEIDGMRALAVLAVITNHFNKDILPSGYLGVDVFFVISGYVITKSLSSQPASSMYKVLTGFYSRRVKRLFPALFLCVLITGIVACLFNPQPLESLHTGVTALFGSSNFTLLYNATNYFGESAELNFFTQTWTLGVEEQFYFIFPLIFLYMMHFERNKKKFLVLLFFMSALSICMFVLYAASYPSVTFFMMPFRFWELGAGCMLLIMQQSESVVSRYLGRINTKILLVLLIAAFFMPQKSLVPVTIVVVGLSFLLIASLGTKSSTTSCLGHPYLVFVGLMSYSLYLWHWSVIVLGRWTIGIHWWSVPIQVALIFLLAYFSYKYVEKPLRFMQWNRNKIMDLGYAIALSLLVSVVLLSLVGQGVSKIYLGSDGAEENNKKKSRLFDDFRNDPDYNSFLVEAMHKQKVCNMTPHHLTGTAYRPAPVIDEDFVSNCLSSSKNKVVLVGDSFANAVSMHVAHAAYAVGYDFSMIFGYGCPYPLNIKNLNFSAKNQCEVSSDFLKESLKKNLNAGDVVILRLFFQKGQYISLEEDNIRSAVSSYDKEVADLLLITKNTGSKLLIIGSNGEMDPCDRKEWFNKLQCPNKIDMIDSIRNKYVILHNEHLLELSVTNNTGDFKVINPLKIICSKDLTTCPIENDDIRFMRDNVHLSEAAVDMLYPEILINLQSLVGKKDH